MFSRSTSMIPYLKAYEVPCSLISTEDAKKGNGFSARRASVVVVEITRK